MFEVSDRDGAGRTGILTLGERSCPTPTLLLIDHPRFRIGSENVAEASAGKSFESINSLFSLGSDPGIVTIERKNHTDIPEIHRGGKVSGDPRSIARSLVTQRTDAGYAQALYLPGTGTLREYALLVYSGADILDASHLIIQARKGNYLTPDESIPQSEWATSMCHCPACIEAKGDFMEILTHNLFAAIQELSSIRHAISTGTLRNLVERRVRSDPELVSVLRHLDRTHAAFFSDRVSFTGGRVIGVSEDALHDPRVQVYHGRLADYRKPPGDILLLLPCSARKPYSTSRSHRQFKNITSDFHGFIHEVIVTSPLGLVPREFENFSPAANYDISVTGDWSESERQLVERMLTDLIGKNEYSHIINHTPYGFVSEILKKLTSGNISIVDTVLNGRATSNASLGELGRTLHEFSKESLRTSAAPWKLGTFTSMWTFQFGAGSESLLEGTHAKGRFPFLKLDGSRGQLAMMVPKSQRVSLTMDGGKLLAKGRRNRVFIEDFFPTGDIFAIGVRGADNGIRVGDEVVVVFGDPESDEPDVRGVGIAGMGTQELIESSRGVGVRLRHRAKKPNSSD